jgi:ferric-dicitrate binding protein FerR (iron transport regulator)
MGSNRTPRPTTSCSAKEINRSAAMWLARLESPSSPELWDEFQNWLEAHPRHRAAFIRLRVAWNSVDSMREMRPIDGTIDLDLLSPEPASAADSQNTRSEHRRKILMPPGTRIAAIAEFLLTRETYRRYVKPIIADMQDEYIEHLARGHKWRARWIAARGHFLVVPGWIYALVTRAVKRIFSA